MRTTSLGMVLIGSLALTSGCKEYFTVDEACHPEGNFRGKKLLGINEAAAVDRFNCYRRLTKLERMGIESNLQDSARGHAEYVQKNPAQFKDADVLDYLTQNTGSVGFTGTEVYERMDAANYTLYGINGNQVHEVLGITADVDTPIADMVDEFFRVHWLIDIGLTPSVYDVAFAEITLDADWWQEAAEAGQWESRFGTTDDNFEVPSAGRFIYMVVVAEGQPFERAGELIAYPKPDQTAVPVDYAGQAYETDEDGNLQLVELSQPIHVAYVGLGGAAATTTTGVSVAAAASNPFGQAIVNASISGPGGPMDVIYTNPGETENAFEIIPIDGAYSFIGSGIYALEKFAPDTDYTVYIDLTTVDGPQSYNWTFTTGAVTAAPTTVARAKGPLAVAASEGPTWSFDHKLSVAPPQK